jgi:hypothetical protein
MCNSRMIQTNLRRLCSFGPVFYKGPLSGWLLSRLSRVETASETMHTVHVVYCILLYPSVFDIRHRRMTAEKQKSKTHAQQVDYCTTYRVHWGAVMTSYLRTLMNSRCSFGGRMHMHSVRIPAGFPGAAAAEYISPPCCSSLLA